MKSPFSKLKAVFGGAKAKQQVSQEDHTEAIINDVEDTPFATAVNNVMYAGMSELGGYHFMKTIIIGGFHIKTIKGAQLTIEGVNFTLKLNSDMVELESEASSVPNRSVTQIDFQIEEADSLKIKKAAIKNILLSCKKHQLEFVIYSSPIDVTEEE
ncbi:hypothetical protein [Lacinutrix undariae]